MLQFLVVLAILAIVVLVVSAPIRRARMAPAAPTARVDTDVDEESAQADGAALSQVAELEAARDAKYREIRDAELDHRTGKLSDADFEVVDRGLRAEAVEILHELDRVRGGDENQEGSNLRGAGGEGERRASAEGEVRRASAGEERRASAGEGERRASAGEERRASAGEERRASAAEERRASADADPPGSSRI